MLIIILENAVVSGWAFGF